MDDRFRGLMLDAARLTREGRLDEATRAIQSALGAAPRAAPPRATTPSDVVLDGLVTVVERPDVPRVALPGVEPPGRPAEGRGAPHPPFDVAEAPREVDRREPKDEADPGEFLSGTHAHGLTARDYRLYVPPGASGRARPLVVMLHGCTQDATDFAAGTGMNERAREQDVYVLYPEQSRRANPQGCWNWFKHTHQRRDRGEPALIASMARAIVQRHGLDADRVYVAGLSAGGAMAALAAACHPDVFAAVGVHSGLAPGAAAGLPEALAAMRGPSGPLPGSSRGPLGAHAPARPATPLDVPTIVFHGDRDATVHPDNGRQVVEAALGNGAPPDGERIEHGVSRGGRRYTRRTCDGRDGRPDVEHWTVHGAGHAWSGGSHAGTYTDPSGPEATDEMLRFFLARRRAPRDRGGAR